MFTATPATHSPGLRAPLREWIADTITVVRNMLSPVPPTVDGNTTIPGAADRFDADR
jgi:hypothetical protein